VFLEELARQVRRVELLGPAQFNASNFTWGVCSLPVRLTAADRALARPARR
jgi:hypothetical protein